VAIEYIDESEPPPFWVTVVGLGGCGVHQVGVLQKKYGEAFDGLSIRYFAVDCDSAPVRARRTQRSSVPWVSWRWGSEPYHLCPRSCQGDPALARGNDWERVNPDITERFDFAVTDVLILLAGFGKGAGTGISQALAAQARLAGIPAFVLAALPFQSEKLCVNLATEMSLLEGVCDGVLYFDQESHGESTFIPPETSIGERLRITNLRIEGCFHELLEGMTCEPLEGPMHVPNVANCFVKEGRIGTGFAVATCTGGIREALAHALHDAKQMATIPNPRHGFLRISHPVGMERKTVWQEMKVALHEIPISRSMAFDKSLAVDDSLVNEIVISVFLAKGEASNNLPAPVSEQLILR
jgi:hypothetical protein